MYRIPNWLRRALFLLAALVVLYAGASLWISAVANSRLAERIEEIRARGEPLELMEMAPPPVPDSENAAALLLEAHDVWSRAPESPELRQARERFQEDPLGASESDVAAVRDLVERSAIVLALLEEALQRSTSRFSDATGSMDSGAPWLSAVLEPSRLLLHRSYLRAREGRIEDAHADALGSFQLGQLVGTEPTLISVLVRIALRDRALGALRDLWRLAPVPAPAADAWIAALDSVRVDEELHRALLGERCFGHWALERAGAGEMEGQALVMPSLARLALPKGIFRLDHAWYLERMARAIELAGPPWHEAESAWSDYRAALAHRPWYAPASALVLPMLPSLVERTEEHRARLDLARIALTVDPAADGDLPPAPAGSERGNTDPFTGKPYLLTRTKDGFTVRSAGSADGDPERRLVWD